MFFVTKKIEGLFWETNEFYFQDLHKIHQNEEEATIQTLQIIKIYKKIIK